MQKRDLFFSSNSARILKPHDVDLSEVFHLIKSSFAFMAGRIDPPSSIDRLTLEKLFRMAEVGSVVVLGKPVIACVVVTAVPHAMYLGKMAVDPSVRGQGAARALVEARNTIALDHGVACLELKVRIELLENQRVFTRIGFVKTSEHCHPGYDEVTEITMQRRVR